MLKKKDYKFWSAQDHRTYMARNALSMWQSMQRSLQKS